MVTSPFEYFAGRNNAKLVEMLNQNQSISNFVMAVIEHAAAFASERGARYDQIQLESPFAHDEYIRARLTVR